MKGYKIFNPDWTCRDIKYEVGQTYKIKDKPKLCCRGFHFCDSIKRLFEYYKYDTRNHIAEIEALGDINRSVNNAKFCTNKIKIVREISWDEIPDIIPCIVDKNHNIGIYNSGIYNNGNYNTGSCNDGSSNSGSNNYGNHNTGSYNVGFSNTGNHNYGDFNIGDYNIGYYNSRNYNKGDNNIGDHNLGNLNMGSNNIGNKNYGYNNIGSHNYGDFNIGDNIYGSFSTENSSTLQLFNKSISLDDYNRWKYSGIRDRLVTLLRSTYWVKYSDINKSDTIITIIDKHQQIMILDGILLARDKDEYFSHNQEVFDNLTTDDKDEIIEALLELPNFDKEIFKQCTGIDIDAKQISHM